MRCPSLLYAYSCYQKIAVIPHVHSGDLGAILLDAGEGGMLSPYHRPVGEPLN